ncbi:MAG: PAS domain S-box protein [Chloroflexota bacterium]
MNDPTHRNKPRILIVDDDPGLRAVLCDLLDIKGFAPVAVETGQEALDQVEQADYAVALVDLRLEDMPGLEVLRGVKARSPETECILLTGHASTESAIQAANLGIYSYVQKPFDVEQLLLTIRRAVEKGEAEIALRESEKRFQALAETSPVGIFRTDASGATTYVNPRWCEIAGLPAGQALGDGWLRAVHPDDREKLTSGWQEATQVKRVSTAEYRFLRPDGTLAWVLGQAVPETGLSGEITGYIGTITDITERRLADDALRASEARYRALVEKLPAIVYVDDATAEPGQSLYISPLIETVLGYSAEEWLREGLDIWADRIHPDDRQRARSAYLHAFETGEPFDCEYRLAAADGRMVWFRDQAVMLRDEKGQLRWFQGVMYDITERKQAEQALKEDEARIQRLLEQQVAVNQLALALGESLDLGDVYHIICTHIRGLVDVWCFIISSYDEQEKIIRAEYVEADQVYDVSGFPTIPLGEPGQGTQSRVIHTGQPYYTPDHQQALSKSKVRYTIEDNGSVHEESPAERDKEDTTRSTVYLPMKVKGKTVGVMQVQSTRLDAYSPDDIQLLSAMANVAAVAIQNTSLHQEGVTQIFGEEVR